MKKVYIFVILTLLIVLIQLFLYYSNVVYHWDIILLEFIIIFFLLIIYSFVCLFLYNKLLLNFNNLNYEYVIINGKKLLKVIPKGVFYDNVLLMLSIVHFTKYEDNLFKTYIEKISAKKIITAKYYWLTIYYIIEKDNDNAKNHFDVFLELNQYENYAFYKKILQTIIHIKSKSVKSIIMK